MADDNVAVVIVIGIIAFVFTNVIWAVTLYELLKHAS